MREVSNAEWDDIQDLLKGKDAEIERLKGLLKTCALILEKRVAITTDFIEDLRKAAQ